MTDIPEGYFRCRPMTIVQAAQIAKVSFETLKTRMRQEPFVGIIQTRARASGSKRQFPDYEVITLAVHSRLVDAGLTFKQAEIATLLTAKRLQDEWIKVDGVPYLALDSFTKDRFIIFGRNPDGNLTFDLAENDAEFDAATSGATHASYDHAPVFTVCNLGTTLSRIMLDMTALEFEMVQKAEAKLK